MFSNSKMRVRIKEICIFQQSMHLLSKIKILIKFINSKSSYFFHILLVKQFVKRNKAREGLAAKPVR